MSFFFFQAEDGIRDTSVTGVQTCALPILFTVLADVVRRHGGIVGQFAGDAMTAIFGATGAVDDPAEHAARAVARSEERRVGKECRARGGPAIDKQKQRSVQVTGRDIMNVP